MRAALYRLLRRVLSQEARNRLKRRVAHTRARLAPLYRRRYGTFSAADLRGELARRIPPDSEIVMVHSSMNDLAPMYTGTAGELLDALLSLCGDERTLAMPAFFFGGADGNAAAHYRAKPVFDARRQPSQMGLLTELFRRRKGVRRSLHPTASICALGPLAGELVDRHHLAPTTFGEGTPFAVMAARRTAIVGIGTEYFRCLSQVHAAEDLLGERFPLPLRQQTVPVEIRDAGGDVHSYELAVDEPSQPRRMALLERIMGPGELVRWKFHGVPMFVVSAAAVTDALSAAALRGETIYEAMPIRRGGAGATRRPSGRAAA